MGRRQPRRRTDVAGFVEVEPPDQWPWTSGRPTSAGSTSGSRTCITPGSPTGWKGVRTLDYRTLSPSSAPTLIPMSSRGAVYNDLEHAVTDTLPTGSRPSTHRQPGHVSGRARSIVVFHASVNP
jgi:hypothetical protein